MSFQSIGDAMKSFLKDSKLSAGVQAARITLIWPEIVGNTIAKYTQKLELKQNTLFIYTEVAPLKNELLYQKALLIKRINKTIGEEIVKDIVIR